MAGTILIAGGGIGGLTAGLALARQGFACEIFEQAGKTEGASAGIQLSPNAMHVLEALGLGAALAARGFFPTAGLIRHFRTGQVMLARPLKDFCRARYGADYLHIHRADLRQILLEAVEAAGVVIHPNAAVSGYVESEKEITLKGGAAARGALLVGADGIRSSVRAQMKGGAAAQFTGQAAWRGLVPADALPPGHISADANLWAGPGKHFVAYYVRGGALINFIAVQEQKRWAEENWQQPGDMAELRAAFAGWDAKLIALLDACQTCRYWGLFDRPALPCWHRGRVVLLGDACHPMLPFLAQGAAMAIEDAYVLAACLARRRDDWRSALASYQQHRKPRGEMMQRTSRAQSRIYHRRSALVRRGQFALARLIPGLAQTRLDKIYGVNVVQAMADAEPLQKRQGFA